MIIKVFTEENFSFHALFFFVYLSLKPTVRLRDKLFFNVALENEELFSPSHSVCLEMYTVLPACGISLTLPRGVLPCCLVVMKVNFQMQ